MNEDALRPSRAELRFDGFKRALGHLRSGVGTVRIQHGELLSLEEEGLIQRFEYTFELGWKVLKDLAAEEATVGDLQIGGPRPAIRWALEVGWIADGVTWFAMLESRNLTSHLYDRESVHSTLEKIVSRYLECFNEFEKVLGDHFARGPV